MAKSFQSIYLNITVVHYSKCSRHGNLTGVFPSSQASFVILHWGGLFSFNGSPVLTRHVRFTPRWKFSYLGLCTQLPRRLITPRKKQLAPPLPVNCPKLTKSWKKQPVSVMPKSNSMGSSHSWTKLDPLHPGTLKGSLTLIYNGRQYLWNCMWLLESRDVYLSPQWFLNAVQIHHEQGRGACCGRVCL